MIDTHCHLLMLEKDSFNENLNDEMLENLITISTTLEDSEKNIELSKKYKKVFATVGIYPEYAAGITENDFDKLEILAKEDKVVAIGEIGLDYHTEGYDKEAQKKVFARQLEIADKLGKPFCIHCRGAAEDVYQILKANKHLINHSGLMHCYSEGSEWVQKFLELGLYISFSGNITFKKVDSEFVKNIPIDKILVETDSPYLAPVPLRGTVNQPKNVRYVIEFLANKLGIDFDKLENITTANAKKFYNIKDK